VNESRASSALAVIVDGRKIEGDEARAIWVRFSAHMDEHEGDMDGFARAEGLLAARTEHRAGQAVLILSSTPLPPAPVAPRSPPAAPHRGSASRPPPSRAPSRRRRRG